MIYIKRILWLIGVLPVCLIISIWFMIELFTMPLKIILHFIVKGDFENGKLEWFDFLVRPCLDYLQKCNDL
jgi:hypothetical protein